MREKLKAFRKADKLTALALGERAGTTEPRIYAFERGRQRPHIDEAIRIAAALRVAPVEIFPDMRDELVNR